MGKVKAGKKIYESLSKVVKGLSKSDAEKILDKVDTPEKAVALTGDARAEYLKALDTVYGPQAARAKGMGFGEQDWYHGTTVPIDKFQNDALGLSTNAQSAKKGFFFAQDPSTASDYAELAREKGVIREGDKVTTSAFLDRMTPQEIAENELKNLNLDIQSSSSGPLSFGNYNPKTDGVSLFGTRYKSIEELDELEKSFRNKLKEFPEDADFLEKKIRAVDLARNQLGAKEHLLNDMISRKSQLEDIISSTGQNVLPVKLRPSDGKVHVKDYRGQGYRDTTYADEMAKAQEKGASGVLFKNTYDPADPNNRVKQNIAAVFEPNQIRSKFAAFDPRFKNSPLLMAGTAGGSNGNNNAARRK